MVKSLFSLGGGKKTHSFNPKSSKLANRNDLTGLPIVFLTSMAVSKG